MMTYQGVVDRIQLLSGEQLSIYTNASTYGLSDIQRSRLVELKTELQDLWLQRKQGRTHLTDPLDHVGE